MIGQQHLLKIIIDQINSGERIFTLSGELGSGRKTLVKEVASQVDIPVYYLDFSECGEKEFMNHYRDFTKFCETQTNHVYIYVMTRVQEVGILRQEPLFFYKSKNYPMQPYHLEELDEILGVDWRKENCTDQMKILLVAYSNAPFRLKRFYEDGFDNLLQVTGYCQKIIKNAPLINVANLHKAVMLAPEFEDFYRILHSTSIFVALEEKTSIGFYVGLHDLEKIMYEASCSPTKLEADILAYKTVKVLTKMFLDMRD